MVTNHVAQLPSWFEVLPFRADRRVLAVAGVHDRLRWEGEQYRTDRSLNRRAIAERSTSRTWPTVEQCVAGEDRSEFWRIKTHGTRRMTWRVKHRQRGTAYRYLLPVG